MKMPVFHELSQTFCLELSYRFILSNVSKSLSELVNEEVTSSIKLNILFGSFALLSLFSWSISFVIFTLKNARY